MIENLISVERLKVSITQKQLNTLQFWNESWKYVKARIDLEKVLSEMKKKRPKEINKKYSKLWWQYITQCIISLHRNAKKTANST